jgi:hypothetical protein
MTPSPVSPVPRLEVGRLVRTPSGAIAQVVALYLEAGEALVRWPNGQEARFRLKLLLVLPRDVEIAE